MQNTPTTSLSFNETTTLEFPAITICNYNGRAGSSCPECDLNLVRIFRLTVTGITSPITDGNIRAEKTQVLDNVYYSCYKINNDKSNLFLAKKKGISGSISFLFEIPTGSSLSRNGLQVTFHEPGATPSIYQETQFAAPGVENYFSLTKVVRTVLDMNYDTNSAVRNVTFDSVVSTIAVTDIPSNNVLVTVTYGTMSVYNIDEVLTNTIPSLLGDVAGMIGLVSSFNLIL
ncbi:predicted protein [Naegleria gruberi]|uniref:Predicted protein n=1 Tax=Naegleria gruberi TaxID=5762 RepID=D2UZW7_NAEGR|nr:uncharacterized protein NAEGRDRAFT_62088 [Naegleria gruberi]EFC50004.1 predicted protein [Naegleria gruberi]|eukprot:XP_002682748.1 predicted protein [Naegleria gruberi strain NEG-M]